MTVIAAIARDGHVVMGADVACSYAGLTLYKAESKIRELNTATDERVLIGAAGNASLLSALCRELKIAGTPGPDAPADAADEWADATAIAITSILHDAKPSLLTNASETDPASLDGVFLLAWRSHAWMLFTHAALRPNDGVITIGSGSDVALGAIHTALALGATPDRAMHHAITYASTYADGCRLDERGPIIHTTGATRA